MQPQSPVSVPPWDPPANGTQPRPYGTQRTARWRVGDAPGEKQLIDCAQPAPFLYRVSCFGAGVVLRLIYGTQATREITELRTPFVAAIPGQVAVYARPLLAEVPEGGLVATCTVTQASGGARAEMRSLIDATGGAVAFHPDAARFVALAASSATIAGVGPLVVALLASVPIVAGSTLNTGVGFQEFEP